MLTRWTIIDLETCTAPDALPFMPPIEADGRLTDPVKIAADIEKKKAAFIDRGGLDPDFCQIVCAGIREHDGTEHILVATNPAQEAAILERVWRSVNRTCPMLGFGLVWFDAGVLVRRSQLLGVKVPSDIYRQAKYRHDMIVDLSDYLTVNGLIDFKPEQRKGRGLDFYCKRFGIEVEDAHDGADVAALWKAGNIEAIKAHCAADILRIRLLAEDLGVIAPFVSDALVQPLEEAGAF